jgi:hypothetical protein
LQALARLSMAAHGAAYNLGFVWFGFGSTVFCYVWFKSRYVPTALAAWGMFASLLLGTRGLLVIVFPELAAMIATPVYFGPIFIFEVTMGFWLLLKALPPSAKPIAPVGA